MNTARFWSIAIPVRAATGAASPNTPTGAVHRIQCMSLMSASVTESASETSGSRFAAGRVVVAAANSTVNTMIGSSDPAVAASNGFRGMRLTRK